MKKCKYIFIILISGLVIFLYASCTAERVKDEENQKREEKEDDKSGNLIVWQIYDESQEISENFRDIWQDSLDRLLKEKDVSYEVKIEAYYDDMDKEQFSPGQAMEKLRSEGVQADVISIPPSMRGTDDTGKAVYSHDDPYLEMAGLDLLEPLDDRLGTEKGAEIKAAVSERELKRTRIDGVTYGLAQHMRMFNATAYQKELLEKYGIDPEELSADIFENEEVLKMVHDGEGEAVTPYLVDAGALFKLGFWIQDECSLLACRQDGSFVNVFETEELSSHLHKLHGLREQGLADSSDQDSGDFFATSYYADTNQMYTAVYPCYSPSRGDYEIDIAVVPDTRLPMLGFYGGNSANGIASWSEHKEEAFDFLKLLYTDADIANLIQYGNEGKEYTIENGHVVYGEYNMLRYYGQHFTNPLLTYTEQGLVADKRAMVEQCYEENEKDMPDGFRFDMETVQTEIDAVEGILGSHGDLTEEGRRLLEADVDDIDTALNSFNQKLKAAGSDKIVEGANRQLEEWQEGR